MSSQQLDKTAILERIAAEAVSDRVDLWPAIHARVAHNRASTRRWLLPSVAAAAIAAIVGVTAALQLVGTDSVSAQTILDRASREAAAAAVSSYHLRLVRGQDTTDLWYGGPDKQRSTQHSADGSGQDIVFNGPDTWIASTDKGQTTVIHTIGTEWNKPAEAPTPQGGLADLLKRYAQKDCAISRLEPQDGTVAGHTTYVVGVTPRTPTCQMNQLRIWVDKQTFLPLRTEVRDQSGNLIEQTQATVVDYNVAISDSTFAYTPPAGVQVRTFNGGTGAEVKRAMFGDNPPQPVSKPLPQTRPSPEPPAR
ncbi:MAG: outer membrane lipoprotein-sorting protein [Chloroflexi bacterium]|nr:outer membrane lipoprotein-sorting protein [Chloroflexota bacterium]